jgi:hypothetical protein
MFNRLMNQLYKFLGLNRRPRNTNVYRSFNDQYRNQMRQYGGLLDKNLGARGKNMSETQSFEYEPTVKNRNTITGEYLRLPRSRGQLAEGALNEILSSFASPNSTPPPIQGDRDPVEWLNDIKLVIEQYEKLALTLEGPKSIPRPAAPRQQPPRQNEQLDLADFDGALPELFDSGALNTEVMPNLYNRPAPHGAPPPARVQDTRVRDPNDPSRIVGEAPDRDRRW